MPENLIREYFSKYPFINNKFAIFQFDCKDEGCELKGDFNDYIILNGDNIKKALKKNQKSVDKIIFLKKAPNKKVDLILCELTRGNKRYNVVVEKIKESGEYIIKVLQDLGFKINKIKCVFVGKYKNPNLVKPKPFSIPGFHENNIYIKKLSCGEEFSKIF